MRPDPRVYPPAVLPSVPPVRLGRSVDAKGARPEDWAIWALTLDFGSEARSNLDPERAPVEKCRTVASREPRAVLYQRDWLWRIRANLWRGCLVVFRTSMGSSCAWERPASCASSALEARWTAVLRLLTCLARRLCQCTMPGMGGMIEGVCAQHWS